MVLYVAVLRERESRAWGSLLGGRENILDKQQRDQYLLGPSRIDDRIGRCAAPNEAYKLT